MTITFTYTGNSLLAVDHGVLWIKYSDPNELNWTGETEKFVINDPTLDGLSPETVQSHVSVIARRLWDQLQNKDKSFIFWMLKDVKIPDWLQEPNRHSMSHFSRQYQGSWICDPIKERNLMNPDDNTTTRTLDTMTGRAIVNLMRDNEKHIKEQYRESDSANIGDMVWLLPHVPVTHYFNVKCRVIVKKITERRGVTFQLMCPASGETFDVNPSDFTFKDAVYYANWKDRAEEFEELARQQYTSHVHQGALANLYQLFLELKTQVESSNWVEQDTGHSHSFVGLEAWQNMTEGFGTIFGTEEGEKR